MLEILPRAPELMAIAMRGIFADHLLGQHILCKGIDFRPVVDGQTVTLVVGDEAWSRTARR